MIYYFTFSGKGTPGKQHYASVVAPCEVTAIKKVVSAGGNNWSTLYTSIHPVKRAKLKLWKEL